MTLKESITGNRGVWPAPTKLLTIFPSAPIPYQNKTLTGHNPTAIIVDDPQASPPSPAKPKPPIDWFAINKEFSQ